jgi:hypothetical protein
MIESPRTYPAVLLPFVTDVSSRDASWLGTIRYSRPVFDPWDGSSARPSDTKGGKPLVTMNDQPCFGEIAILRSFETDGWEGRWIDNYPLPPTFRTAYWDESWNKLPRTSANRPLPATVLEVYQRICAEAGDVKGGGAWDIIAWRGNEMAFVECKKLGSSDRIKAGQLGWLQAGLRIGIPCESFVFAEWTVRKA